MKTLKSELDLRHNEAIYEEQGNEPLILGSDVASARLRACAFVSLPASLTRKIGDKVVTTRTQDIVVKEISGVDMERYVIHLLTHRAYAEVEEYLPKEMPCEIVDCNHLDGMAEIITIGECKFSIGARAFKGFGGYKRSIKWTAYDPEGDELCTPTTLAEAFIQAASHSWQYELRQAINVCQLNNYLKVA